ncbi:MAG TPA: hypothetical protein VLG12_05545 [Candidatus Saccharimonadales bacterium]|nr:hypothetical protein [Candidatus Saccharimonadales bacterium]
MAISTEYPITLQESFHPDVMASLNVTNSLSPFVEGPTLRGIKRALEKDSEHPDKNSYFSTSIGEAVIERYNQQFYARVGEVFEIAKKDPEEFYLEQILDAHLTSEKVFSSLLRRYPEDYKRVMGALTKSSSTLLNPAEPVKILKSEQFDPETGYSLLRQAHIAVVLGELESASRESETVKELETVTQLAQRLFDVPPEEQALFSLHDNHTNQIKGFGFKNPNNVGSTEHIIEHRGIKMGYINGVGRTSIPIRHKEKIMQGIKALTRPAERIIKDSDEQGQIKARQDVTDVVGVKIIAEDAFSSHSPKVTNAMSKFEKIIRSHYGDAVEIISDNENNNVATQSGRFRFQRFQIVFKHKALKIEVMGHGRGDEIHNTMDVGVYDPSKKKWTGAAHDFLNLRKYQVVAPYMLPDMIFGIDTDEAAHYEAQFIAQNLLAQRIVTYSQFP